MNRVFIPKCPNCQGVTKTYTIRRGDCQMVYCHGCNLALAMHTEKANVSTVDLQPKDATK